MKPPSQQLSVATDKELITTPGPVSKQEWDIQFKQRDRTELEADLNKAKGRDRFKRKN